MTPEIAGARWADGGHGEGSTFVVAHGTPGAYTYYGCRCELCKAWKRTYRRKYRRRPPEQKRSEQRKAYARNPEKYKAKNRAWAERNREWRSEYGREYYAANRERMKAMINAKVRARNEHTKLTATHAGTRWTEAEDRVLMDLSMSNVAAAKAVGRTFSAVSNRRSRLRKQGLI